MPELLLLAEFSSREEAKSRALAIAAAQGKSPTLRRSGTGWGLFAPHEPIAIPAPVVEVRRAAATPKAVVTRTPRKVLSTAKLGPKLKAAGARATPLSATKRSPSTSAPAARKAAPAAKPRLGAKAAVVIAKPQPRTKRSARTTGAAPLKARTTRQGTWSMSPAEARRMAAELRHAYSKMSPKEASAWVGRTITLFRFVSARRVKNLGGLALTVLDVTGGEVIGLVKAAFEGKGTTHVGKRISHGSNKVAECAVGIRKQAAPIFAELKANPKEVAPDLLVVALAFYFAGGGVDGDGGIPDSDITLLGIEAHRSVFTHSIVAGAVVETALYSLVDFIATAHRHLPKQHDPRWTLIHDRFKQAAQSGAKGMSLGLAYHLGVDGLLQPGAYHDIPIAMPMEVHQAILTTNAVTEGVDSTSKRLTVIEEARKKSRQQNAVSTLSVTKPKKDSEVANIVVGAGTILALLLGLS